MLIMLDTYGIITPSIKGAIDIMNSNSIISLAMIYALWQTNKNDLLDLIRPFVIYAIGNTTHKNGEIVAEKIARYMEEEFGYKSFQVEVVKRILSRETANNQIEKRNKRFYLIGSYQKQVEEFNTKRTACKSHSDRVTHDLVEYLNNHAIKGRKNYTQKDAEVFLLSFFERQGASVILSVEDLRNILFKDNEIDFYIGHFILEAKENNSVLIDYLVELVAGYFVTTALYLQAENRNVTSASFSNVTFFLDTRLLLGLLGYKAKEENDSIQETVACLIQHGAKIALFDYNANEVHNILEAYKQSKISNTSPSLYTLEHFDEIDAGYSVVDFEQHHFREYLSKKGLVTESFGSVLFDTDQNDFRGAINVNSLKDSIRSIKPTYKFMNDDDIDAIDSISRIRKGEKLPFIEKCKAVFVTSNTVLVAATKKYLLDEKMDVGFPLVITGEDLCIISWLKEFGQSSRLPQMRLLENVLAAITPDRELLHEYFTILDNMKERGEISTDEVKLLQIDLYARNELMERTHGVKERLSENIVNDIREAIRKDSYEAGAKDAMHAASIEAKEKEQQVLKDKQDQRNRACRIAEDEISIEYQKKEQNALVVYKAIGVFIALLFITASLLTIFLQENKALKWATAFVAFISCVQGIIPFFKKNTRITKQIQNHYEIKKNIALDERKKQYLSILESDHFSE